MQNDERFQRQRNLSPVEPAAAWLNGDFGVEDDLAMMEAVRRDSRIKATDAEIALHFSEALRRRERNAQRCLDDLARGG